LARDVVTLTQLGEKHQENLVLIPAIKRSNDQHRGWAFQILGRRWGEWRGRRVALLGLVYTPNTDTLRRSAAVELCQQLLKAGAQVRAFDPAVKSLPAELARVELCADLQSVLSGADAAVVCTEWPQFREGRWSDLIRAMRQPVIIVDANRFLEKQLATLPAVEHLSVGKAGHGG
jgi:UDPglucose 6-dehydrogenase